MTKSKRKDRENEGVDDAESRDEAVEAETADAATDDTQDAGEPAPEPTLEEQLAEARDRMLRAHAEADNARRRARLDVDEVRRFGATPLLRQLLTVVDNFQRALENPPEGVDTGFLEGIRMIEQQLLATLGDHGVTPIDVQPGDALDPNRHQALVEQPTADVEPGTVVSELVRGFMIHDRLLREAQVAVARAPDEA